MRIPTLIDIHKKKGKRPHFDIYIGRRREYTEFTEDSKWKNKFFKRLDLYEKHIRKHLWDDLDELDEKILGCWCLDIDFIIDEKETMICHGQVLMKLFKEKLKYFIK